MFEVVLSDFRCIRETSGRGDDEVVAFFDTVGVSPFDGSPVRATRCFRIEDVNSGDILIDGNPATPTTVSGIEAVGAGISRGSATPGLRLSEFASDAGPPPRLSQPDLPIVVATIGLEIDGSDSTAVQAAEHLTRFVATGTVDHTVGVDDDRLWSLAWTVALVDGTPTVAGVREVFPPGVTTPDNDLLLTTVANWDAERQRLRQNIVARNTDQGSRYDLTFDYQQV